LFFIDVDSEVLKNHQSIIDRKLEKYEKENWHSIFDLEESKRDEERVKHIGDLKSPDDILEKEKWLYDRENWLFAKLKKYFWLVTWQERPYTWYALYAKLKANKTFY
jgi:hypothetical protein